MSAELRGLIREKVRQHPKADPRELAKHVAAATSDIDLLGFYEETLCDYIAAILRHSRNDSLDNVGRRSANPSPKLADIRAGFKRLCAERVHVGHSHWKILGDCTEGDLAFCIAEREQDVDRIQNQIGNYHRLINLLHQHKVAKVSQLPPQAVLS